jgi:DNA-binding transcriptional MerR regulator
MKSSTGTGLIRPATKLYRIGDVVRHTPFSRQTIHNYTIMGLIREAEWTQGGHRLYDESVFDRLSVILSLRQTKTLSQIREILSRKDPEADPQMTQSRPERP